MNDSKILEQIGKRISDRRRQIGMTQEKLAEIVGLSLQSISCIELGKKGARPENLMNICRALETSADYILFGTIDNRYIDEITQKLSQLTKNDFELVSVIIDRLSTSNQ